MGGEREKEAIKESTVSLLKGKNLLIVLVSIYVATALVIWIYSYHENVMKNYYLVNDDSLPVLFVFYKVGNMSFPEVSEIAKYYMDFYPLGYKSLYQISAVAGVDPILFSKLLTAFLFFSTLALGATLGLRVSGITGFTFMFTMIFICEGFFERMAGGLLRAFAYPLAFLFAYGVFSRKIVPLILSLVLSILFYPPLAPFFGSYIGLVLIFPKKLGFLDLTSWSWQKKLFLFLVTMFVCLVLTLPTVKAGKFWGPIFTNKQATNLPEMSLDGRYGMLDRTPVPSLLQAVDIVQSRVFRLFNRPRGEGQVSVTDRYGVLFVLLFFLPWLICRKEKVLPLTLMWIILMFLYIINSLLYPKLYIPTRFVHYLMPVLFISGLTLVIEEVKILLSRFRIKPTFTYGIIPLAMVVGLIYAPSAKSGFYYDFRPIASLYDTIRKLPPDITIAGWPDPVLDAVPLFGQRPILVGYETYQLFHKRYLFMVRERMNDTVRLLFTESKEEFKLIKDKYNISYVLVPPQIYQKCDSLRIFSPFSGLARDLCNNARKPIIRSIKERDKIWADKGYILVDLNRVDVDE